MAHQAARAGHIIQFPERQQPSIRGDAATVELQLEAPVKIEPKNVRFRFTRWWAAQRRRRVSAARYAVIDNRSENLQH
jgi:hypothetical protein